MWAGAMVSLYGGVVAFLALIFDYLNYTFPDTTLGYYTDPYQGGVAYEMASLIVLAPVFLILMRIIRRSIAQDPTRNETWVRRWGLFLTVFLAGTTIVIDLIVLLTTFLQGEELSVRFLLKVAVVLLVAAAGFMHFLADLWGYWQKNPQYARSVNWATGALVVLTIVAGFFIIGSPQNQRILRVDQQRTSDLQSLQSQLVYVYQQKGTLPALLSELNDPLSYFAVPVDPETKTSYEYTKKGPLAFELCATFGAEDASNLGSGPRAVAPTPYGKNDNWQHGAGRQCFERTIDPLLYPRFKN